MNQLYLYASKYCLIPSMKIRHGYDHQWKSPEQTLCLTRASTLLHKPIFPSWILPGLLPLITEHWKPLGTVVQSEVSVNLWTNYVTHGNVLAATNGSQGPKCPLCVSDLFHVSLLATLPISEMLQSLCMAQCPSVLYLFYWRQILFSCFLLFVEAMWV